MIEVTINLLMLKPITGKSFSIDDFEKHKSGKRIKTKGRRISRIHIIVNEIASGEQAYSLICKNKVKK